MAHSRRKRGCRGDGAASTRCASRPWLFPAAARVARVHGASLTAARGALKRKTTMDVVPSFNRTAAFCLWLFCAQALCGRFWKPFSCGSRALLPDEFFSADKFFSLTIPSFRGETLQGYIIKDETPLCQYKTAENAYFQPFFCLPSSPFLFYMPPSLSFSNSPPPGPFLIFTCSALPPRRRKKSSVCRAIHFFW